MSTLTRSHAAAHQPDSGSVSALPARHCPGCGPNRSFEMRAGNQAIQRSIQDHSPPPALRASTVGDHEERAANRFAERFAADTRGSVAARGRRHSGAGGYRDASDLGPGDTSRGESALRQAEREFGVSLAGVRVETGAQATGTARALHARAFTIGDTIVFGEGEYQPQTQRGRRLLGHELAHVVQQRRTGPMLQRQAADATQMSITPGYAAGLSDEELARQAQLVRTQLWSLDPDNPEYVTLYQNLVILLQEASTRPSLQPSEVVKTRSGYSMLPRMVKWQAAGLLDPPWRPSNVPAFEPFPVTAEQASQINRAFPPGGGWPTGGAMPPPIPIIAGMAPLGGVPVGPQLPPGGFPPGGFQPGLVPGGPGTPPVEIPLRPPLQAPPTGTPPLVEPPVAGPGAATGTGVGARVAPFLRVAVPAAVFFTVLLWPSETAPAWMDELNQVTGEPYASPEEFRWLRRLTREQEDYLRHLHRASRQTPDPTLEEDPQPWDVPREVPRSDEEEGDLRRRRACYSAPIPRRGGHPRHDAYATKVTGSASDHYVRNPVGIAIAYDGAGLTGFDMWEVKVGFGWFFNPAYAGLTDLTLRRFDAQMARGLVIAISCGYAHLWSIPDRWVAQLLNARWGGIPPVLAIPE